ncbi:MAG TPA: MbcA/ParS/Xre antitoxin family protein [Bryobacteraceae bacterium]|nr:MbcA/ParS/Xre antitoxin family protein [Bryobacteraceae bacterium]
MGTPRKAAQRATQPSLRDRVRQHVFETFGEEAKAIHWLNRPNQLFGGKTPAEALETEPESVEHELTRIDHGIFV